MLNYYIEWTFYFTCQGLSTAEFPDVKVSRRHVLLQGFTIGNKKLSLYPNGILFLEVARGPYVFLIIHISSIIAIRVTGHKP